MAKFAHIADVHLDCRRFSGDVLQERRRDSVELWLDACKAIADEKCDFVLLCGDLYHSRTPSDYARSAAAGGLGLLLTHDIPVIAIPGNHDAPNAEDGVGPLNRLEEEGYLTLLDDIDRRWNASVGNCDIYGLSWYGAETENGVLDLTDNTPLNQDRFNILMLHAGYEGLSHRAPEDISRNTMAHLQEKFDYVAMGHIHKPFHTANTFMPGSLVATNKTDARSMNRGFWIVETPDDGSFLSPTKVYSHKLPNYRPEIVAWVDMGLGKINKGFIKFLNDEYLTVYNAVKAPLLYLDLIGVTTDPPNLSEIREMLYSSQSFLHIQITDKTTRPYEEIEEAVPDRKLIEQDAFAQVFGDDALLAMEIHEESSTEKILERLLSD